MKSNICKIDKGNKDLELILKESEKVAVYNELNHKQTLQLRLLCEEIDGMLPEIVSDFDGDFWIEFEEGICKIRLSIELADLTLEKKKELINIAKNKKNAASVGVVGKIRSSIENFFLDEDVADAFAISAGMSHVSTGCYEGLYCSYYWSLDQYRATIKDKEKTDDWDELEKSVIASVADDVIVGVKGKRADIIIVKNFA